MKELNSTSVVQTKPFLAELVKFQEPECGNTSSNATSKHSETRISDQITRGSHYNTSSQSSIKQDFHIHLSKDSAAYVDSNKSASRNAQKCVNNCSLLLHPNTESSVETWPVHKKEECANHSDKL
jgi:hypothetical protein